jgi:hypothetical protein
MMQKRILLKHYKQVSESFPVHMDDKDINKWVILLNIENENYIGEIAFPANFPISQPSFCYINDNSRFKPGEKICLGDNLPEADVIGLITILVMKTIEAEKKYTYNPNSTNDLIISYNFALYKS